MPKLGLTMQEGLLSSWLVQPGAEVRPGDILFVVETDKIANEVEATQQGRIGEILVPEGETVPVGTVVALWADGTPASAESAAPGPASSAPAPSAPAAAPQHTEAHSERLWATPLARRLARAAGIDLANIRGSGARGRIMAADIHAATQAPAAPPAVARAEKPAPVQTLRPINQVRRITAQRLTQSKQTIPHFYVMTEVEISALDRLRADLNAVPDSRRITVNHLIVYAVGRALVSMPEMNALWTDEGILQLDSADVGMAVDVAAGVMAPVLRRAGNGTLDAMIDEAARLVTAARDSRLKAEDLTGGAITVSNVGMFGASHLLPIINPGQSMILGVGAARPVFRPDADGKPVLATEMGLVLSCDHRIVDGVAAAKFLNKIKAYLEMPLALLRMTP